MCAADSGAVCRGTQQGRVQGDTAGGHSRGTQQGDRGHSRGTGDTAGGEEHRYSIDTVSGY